MSDRTSHRRKYRVALQKLARRVVRASTPADKLIALADLRSATLPILIAESLEARMALLRRMPR